MSGCKFTKSNNDRIMQQITLNIFESNETLKCLCSSNLGLILGFRPSTTCELAAVNRRDTIQSVLGDTERDIP